MWIKVEKYMISGKTKGGVCLKGETTIQSEHNQGRTHMEPGIRLSAGGGVEAAIQGELYPQPLLRASVIVLNLCVCEVKLS